MKKNILFSFILVSFTHSISNAQFTPVWDEFYQHTITPDFSCESRKMVTDAAGNIFVLADVTSDINMQGVQSTSTFYYVKLLKYSPAGNLLTQAQINVNLHSVSGFDQQSAYGLEADAAGNIYVGYNFYQGNTNFDVRVSKYTNSLSLLWTQKYNPVSLDRGVDMAVDPSGIVYVVAHSVTGTSFQYHLLKSDNIALALNPIYSFDTDLDAIADMGIEGSSTIYVTGSRLVAGFQNVMTASLSNTGVLNWKNIYNGGNSSRDDFGRSLSVGTDDHVYIVGSSDRGAPNGYDMLCIKYYSVTGKRIWTMFDHLNTNDQGFIVNAEDLNFVYYGATSGNSVIMTMFSKLTGIRKARGIYNPVPDNAYLSLAGATLTDMKISPSANFYLTGTIKAYDVTNNLFSAGYLVNYNLELNGRGGFKKDYEVTVAGAFDENYTPTQIVLDVPNSDVYWLRSYFREYPNHQTEGVILDKFSVPSPVRSADSDFDSDVLTVAVTPNPFLSEISLLSSQPVLKLELFELSGKLVYQNTFNDEFISLRFDDYETGTYLLKVHTANTVTVEKIIKN